jgi:hypothetical protein
LERIYRFLRELRRLRIFAAAGTSIVFVSGWSWCQTKLHLEHRQYHPEADFTVKRVLRPLHFWQGGHVGPDCSFDISQRRTVSLKNVFSWAFGGSAVARMKVIRAVIVPRSVLTKGIREADKR